MMRKRRRMAIVRTGGTIVCVVGASIAYAQDCRPGAFPYGPYITVTTTSDASVINNADVAYNSGDDEFMFVWSGYDGSSNQVYGQRISARKGFVGPNFFIADSMASQTEAAVVYNSIENQFFVSWRYQNGPPGSPGFNNAYGRVINADGSGATGETQLYDAGLEATLAYNAARNEYVLEARNFAGTGGGSGIKAVRVGADGQPITPGTIIETAGAPAPAGAITLNSNAGTYLATWRDQTNENLRGRMLSGDLSPAGSAFTISDVFPESGLAASVAFDPVNDRFFVVFATFSGGPIYGRFVSGDGTPTGNEIILHDTAKRTAPYVVYNPTSESFLVTWIDWDSSTIAGQLVAPDGSRYGGQLTIAASDASRAPRAAADPVTGGFVVAWAGRNPQTGDEPVVVARYVDVRKGADFAKPFGKITQKDVNLYKQAYLQGNLIADLAEPFGTIDGADAQAFRDLAIACR